VSGNSLDPYSDRYAGRTRGMTASEIRALFAVASRPEVVSLAGGMPYLPALPMDAVGAMMGELVTAHGAATLQYGSGQGALALRERICDVMALEGVSGSPDDVVVTVGSQQALDLISRVFLDPGDVVLAEGPSYVGALGTFAAAEADSYRTIEILDLNRVGTCKSRQRYEQLFRQSTLIDDEHGWAYRYLIPLVSNRMTLG